MATDATNQRPDPLKDQREAMNRALSGAAASVSTKIPAPKSDAASLDTFNATGAPSAVETAAASLALAGEDDDRLTRHGAGDGDDGQQDLNAEEQARAEEASRLAWENRDQGSRGEGDEQGGAGSPFDFQNPALARAAEEMAGFLPEDERRAGGGTAAGKVAPSSSGGSDGSLASEVGGSTGGGSDVAAGGGGGYQDAVDPFTGQAMGIGAYAAPGFSGLPNMNAVGGFQMDAQMAATMGLAQEAASSRGDASPSVADGDTDVSGGLAALGVVLAPFAPAAAAAVEMAAGIAYAIEAGMEAKELGDKTTAERARILNENGNLQSVGSPEPAPAPPPDQSIEKTGQSVDPDEENPAGIEFTDNQGSRIVLTPGQQLNLLGQQQARGVTPRVKDELPPDSDLGGGPPTPGEIAFRAYLRQALNYHGSPGHNEGVTTPTDEPAVERGPAPSITADRDRAHSMLGQPNPDSEGVGGRGPASVGVLPGDLGNVDPGDESDTGGWTSNSQTEQEADALESLDGSGLSIADARRNSDDDEDDEDEDDDS